MSAGESIIDCFGETCSVLDRCPSCNAPRYRRVGERGTTQMHVNCLRAGAIGNEDHRQACEWSEQSMSRDYGEAKARGDYEPSYSSHLAAPNPRPDFNLGTGRADE